MGLILQELRKIQATHVYWDANIFIYALEAIEPYTDELKDIFEGVDNEEFTAITSELSLAECLVKPFKEGDIAKQTVFERTLSSTKNLKVVPISRSILKEASRMRSTHTAIRLPDAIHLATALGHQCSVFLTNDNRIKGVSGIRLLFLRDFISD